MEAFPPRLNGLMQEPAAKNWFFTVMAPLPRKEWLAFVVTLWAIWYVRRWFIHELQSPTTTHFFIQSFLHGLNLEEEEDGELKA